MMTAFLTTVKGKYKSTVIRKAAEDQRLYEIEDIQNETQKKFDLFVQEKFSRLFVDFIVSSPQKVRFDNLLIYRCNGITKWVHEREQEESIEQGLSWFVEWLIAMLLEHKAIEEYVRPKSDMDFRNYLDEKGYSILLGSQYSFSCMDHFHWSDHVDYLKKFDSRFTGGARRGLALQRGAFSICLEKVLTKIYSPTLEALGLNPNLATGLYEYEPTTGLPLEFEEQELREYIHDERKMVDVYVSVSITMDEVRKGSAIIRPKELG